MGATLRGAKYGRPAGRVLVRCSCVQVRCGVAVLHEHRLRGLRSPRLAATEPTIPQRALGSPLTAIFALVLARASYRSTPGAIRRNRFPAQNAESGHGFTSD